MKATGYVQLTADDVDYHGLPTRLKMARVSKRYPRDPLPGAIIVRLSIEVPDELLRMQADVILDIEEAALALANQEALEEPEPADA